MIPKKWMAVRAGSFPVEVHLIKVFPGGRGEEMPYVLPFTDGFAYKTGGDLNMGGIHDLQVFLSG
jgi:hypothetical protein